MVKRFNLYRVATVLLIIHDVAHALGGVLLHKSSGAAEDSVIDAIRTTHFPLMGADSAYADFQMGYGLITTIFLTLSAFLTWELGKSDASPTMRRMAWALFLCFAGVAWISWRYFFSAPGVISTLVALLLGYKCIRNTGGKTAGSVAAQSLRDSETTVLPYH